MSHFCCLKAGNLCSLGIYLHCFSAIKGNITLITRSSEAGGYLRHKRKRHLLWWATFPKQHKIDTICPGDFFFFFSFQFLKILPGYNISEAPLAPFLGMANDTLILTPVGRGRRGKINVTLDFERRKFYKLKTQLSNCEAENGLVIWSWRFQKHLWEKVPRQWENTGSAPVQTPGSRKAGLFVCLSVSFKDTSGHFWPRHGSLWGKKSLYFKLAFFLDTCSKAAGRQAAPNPTPTPRGHCSPLEPAWKPRLNLNF